MENGIQLLRLQDQRALSVGTSEELGETNPYSTSPVLTAQGALVSN